MNTNTTNRITFDLNAILTEQELADIREAAERGEKTLREYLAEALKSAATRANLDNYAKFHLFLQRVRFPVAWELEVIDHVRENLNAAQTSFAGASLDKVDYCRAVRLAKELNMTIGELVAAVQSGKLTARKASNLIRRITENAAA